MAKSALTWKSNLDSENTWQLSLVGPLDENIMDLPDFPSGIATLKLDLAALSSMNSIGTKTWIRWISALPENVVIEIENAPRHFVIQVNTVIGFVPKRTRLKSILMPFSCDECDRDFDLPHQVQLEGEQILKAQCPDCGRVAEPAVHPDRHFAFLKVLRN